MAGSHAEALSDAWSPLGLSARVPMRWSNSKAAHAAARTNAMSIGDEDFSENPILHCINATEHVKCNG